MKKWSQTDIEYLMSNYKKLSYLEIADKLNRSPGSVYLKAHELKLNKGRWNSNNKLNKQKIIKMLILETKRLGKSPSVREIPISLKSACQRHFGSYNKAKKEAKIEIREYITKLPKRSYKPSKELAYIIGLVLGDGSLRYQRSENRTAYVIVYASKDKELTESFVNNFKKWSDYDLKSIYIMKAGKKIFPSGKEYNFKKAYMAQIPFKEAWIFLKRFKDSPDSCLKFFDNKNLRWVLKGLWDAEGCIRAKEGQSVRIHFSNNSEDLLSLYTKILESYNIRYSRHKTRGCFNIDIIGSNDKEKFVKLINGVTIKRKRNPTIIRKLKLNQYG